MKPATRMQAKDVPDRPVLELLARNPDRWHFRFPLNWGTGDHEWLVASAMPPDTPEKVILAKMRALMRRGLVDGCGCGCRGDFTITEKGLAWLAEFLGDNRGTRDETRGPQPPETL